MLVKPLEDEQISAFAARYLPEDMVDSFLARIFPKWSWKEHRSLIHLARNPYMLTALLTVYEHQGNLPTNTGALFHTLAQVLWERERLRNTPGWIAFAEMRERFGQLAFDMIDADQPLDIPLNYALERIKDEGLLKAGASAGFIRLNQDSVRFSHQLMLEYFAAWGLQHVGVEACIRPPEISWRGREAQKWDEVVVALCGIVDDASDLISQIAEVDLFLATDCIGSGIEVSADCQAPIIARLIQALQDEEGRVRETAAEAIEKIGDAQILASLIIQTNQEKIPLLVQALSNEYEVQQVAIAILIEIGKLAVPHLIQALQDKHWRVREAAAEALGQIGDAQAMTHLMQALQDKDSDVRRVAAWALVKIGKPAVPHLMQTLKDEHSDVRSAAAWTLGRIGDAQAVPHLIQALKDEERDVRRAAAWALGEIGDAQAVPHLMQALKDEYSSVHRAAAKALKKIRTDG
ncbi:MAG: HEAT repeat domain-containing protein [Chloroflexi bacterium]|nr:MAG: HEAT repeat domain-containing protein [Chloroflexota bacterium]